MKYSSESTEAINTIMFYMSFTNIKVLSEDGGNMYLECTYPISTDEQGHTSEVGYDYISVGISICKSYIKYMDGTGSYSVWVEASSYPEIVEFLEDTLSSYKNTEERLLSSKELGLLIDELPF